MRKHNVSAACVATVMIGLWSADARAQRDFPNIIPNGTTYSCSTCHFNAAGGGPRNSFGQAFAGAGFMWSAALCNADSDGDGYSNGVELGDANCDGAADSRGAYAHPGERGDSPCGNGTIEGAELCDGANLNGRTCELEGYGGGGALGCAADCQSLDTSGCMDDPGPIDEPDMDAPGEDMGQPLDMDTPADMSAPQDMAAAPDLPEADDMAWPDLDEAPGDMSAAAPDMSQGADLGAGDDMAPGKPSVSGGAGGDEGCAQAGAARPTGASAALLSFALLGLLGRRRRAV